MTVAATPDIRNLRPTTAGSPPNARCHSPYRITATGATPGFTSSGAKMRPRRAETPSVLKKFSSASAPRVLCGSSPPATTTGKSAKALIEVKLWLCPRQSRKLR